MAENTKIPGLSIASLVLGIVSIVLWCIWFISIPCAILALIFGIIGIKKHGKGFAIAGLITSAIALVIWTVLMGIAFISGMVSELDDISSNYRSYDKPSYSYHSKVY